MNDGVAYQQNVCFIDDDENVKIVGKNEGKNGTSWMEYNIFMMDGLPLTVFSTTSMKNYDSYSALLDTKLNSFDFNNTRSKNDKSRLDFIKYFSSVTMRENINNNYSNDEFNIGRMFALITSEPEMYTPKSSDVEDIEPESDIAVIFVNNVKHLF